MIEFLKMLVGVIIWHLDYGSIKKCQAANREKWQCPARLKDESAERFYQESGTSGM
jgi:hypothetical protein